MATTEMTHAVTLRVLMFRDNGLWVAQALEYDIGAQAPDLDTLRDRFSSTVSAEIKASLERHGKPFAGIDPAPVRFQNMWERRARSIEAVPGAWMINDMNIDLGLVA